MQAKRMSKSTAPRRTRRDDVSNQSDYSSLEEQSFDIVIMADMTLPGDLGLRIAQETRTNFELGYRTGLVHLTSSRAGLRISPDLQICVRQRIADVINPGSNTRTKLLVVHTLDAAADPASYWQQILPDRVVLVLHQTSQIEVIERRLAYPVESVCLAPSNRWIRTALDEARLPVPIETEDWRPIGRALSLATGPRRVGRQPTIGWISSSDATQWPGTKKALEQILPTDGSFEVCLLGRPPKHLIPRSDWQSPWAIYDHGEIAIERFLQVIDALVYFPRGKITELPDAAISAAIAESKIVVLPLLLNLHFGPGANYCERHEVVKTIRTKIDDTAAMDQSSEGEVRGAAPEFSKDRYRDRIERLIGPASGARRRAIPRRKTAGRPRALLIPSNGVGLGHVARLLAIARRADSRFEPVFATLAQAVKVIESFGYLAEYIPSQSYTDSDPSTWDAWFAVELEHLIDRYDARLVVFDGSNPPPSLIRAVASRGDCALAWIRRGMWGEAYTPLIENSRWFDLIIEPGEIAGDRDVGATARRRHEVTLVKPIRLLDEDDLLPRREAASALGLDEAKPAVLIQLGAGSNREILPIIDTVIREIRKFPDVQIAITEWMTGANRLSLWPGVTTIKGFPLGQYFNAFDFSLAEAGYNTFHEAIAFELPTIFVPNTSPGRDDQSARAKFAQDAGAAFELPEDSLSELPEICEVLLLESTRKVIRQNCRRIQQGNGSAEAASALAQLVHLQ